MTDERSVQDIACNLLASYKVLVEQHNHYLAKRSDIERLNNLEGVLGQLKAEIDQAKAGTSADGFNYGDGVGHVKQFFSEYDSEFDNEAAREARFNNLKDYVKDGYAAASFGGGDIKFTFNQYLAELQGKVGHYQTQIQWYRDHPVERPQAVRLRPLRIVRRAADEHSDVSSGAAASPRGAGSRARAASPRMLAVTGKQLLSPANIVFEDRDQDVAFFNRDTDFKGKKADDGSIPNKQKRLTLHYLKMIDYAYRVKGWKPPGIEAHDAAAAEQVQNLLNIYTNLLAIREADADRASKWLDDDIVLEANADADLFRALQSHDIKVADIQDLFTKPAAPVADASSSHTGASSSDDGSLASAATTESEGASPRVEALAIDARRADPQQPNAMLASLARERMARASERASSEPTDETDRSSVTMDMSSN